MGQSKGATEINQTMNIPLEIRPPNRMQVVYARRMREREIFMEDLKYYRKQKDKKRMKAMWDAVGPKWNQALSVPQRIALDYLETAIYQDLLEGRPHRTLSIMKRLGIYPRPSDVDLMNCAYLGRSDPKEMLAQLFQLYYGHSIDGRRSTYDLNGRLLLSGILYLGLDNLIKLLRERFHPDQPKEKQKPKPKPKIEPPLASPYLQKMVAILYEPPKVKKKRPAPLPNLDDLNEPFVDDPPLPKPPPPPPPPPPPKKRLPRAFCDKLAEIITIEPQSSKTALSMKAITQSNRTTRRIDGSNFVEEKKVYGMASTRKNKSTRRRKKLTAPSTGIWNAQYTICGVSTVLGKTVYVLGNISVLPSTGDLIHGGYRLLNGEFITIHCGFRARPPPPKPDPCDCVKRWTGTVLQYVRTTKCYCGHNYDYGNEGTFLPEELPLFQKSTRHSPYHFNYDTIFDLDPKRLHVEKEFKKIWDTESLLHVDDGTNQKKKPVKKKKQSSTTCLGEKPMPQDYLKCALRLMKRVNIAARLPDIQLVPELLEWMRRRIYGPFTRLQKSQMIFTSRSFWDMFTRFAVHGQPHVPVPKIAQFTGHTTWTYKQALNDSFKKFAEKYKIEMFRSHAEMINLMWPSMCQAQLPDKKFREIYFSYMFGTVEDLQVMHPYSSREAAERSTTMSKRRYRCIPAGVETES